MLGGIQPPRDDAVRSKGDGANCGWIIRQMVQPQPLCFADQTTVRLAGSSNVRSQAIAGLGARVVGVAAMHAVTAARIRQRLDGAVQRDQVGKVVVGTDSKGSLR